MIDHKPLRVGLFTHSTNPRGGVVHALELGEALAARGHEVFVHAPAELGRGFFRPAVRAHQALIPATRVDGDLAALVRQRIKDCLAYLLPRGREFDVYHAHDGITGNVLADLTERGLIPGFVRTVHHLDDFSADDYLRRAQDRSVTAAAHCFCVSELWRKGLRDQFGIDAAVVPNGVDLARFMPEPQPQDGELRHQLMSSGGRGPVFLAVGGVERRKNTLNVLRAFLLVRQTLPMAGLLIAGGASLLDHSDYRRDFDELLTSAGEETARAVVFTGPLPDDQMPAAYRLADALVFPSVPEGFGLAVLEAMACGTPVVASRVPPFTEYLGDADALLVDPHDPAAIAAAMEGAVEPATRARLRVAGLALARRFPWSKCAEAHEREYHSLISPNGETSHAGNAVSGTVAG